MKMIFCHTVFLSSSLSNALDCASFKTKQTYRPGMPHHTRSPQTQHKDIRPDVSLEAPSASNTVSFIKHWADFQIPSKKDRWAAADTCLT